MEHRGNDHEEGQNRCESEDILHLNMAQTASIFRGAPMVSSKAPLKYLLTPLVTPSLRSR